MMRQSSGRNQRSRGWKVKHVLQICVLIAVCVWLLYQVKHSHDKKKALEETSLKLSGREDGRVVDFLKLGRKDSQGNTVLTATDVTAQNDEEENKETEEAAEEENKQEENEEEGRMGGGGEIEENDRERADEEAEGVEEFGDEEEKDGQLDDVGLSNGQDHEGADENLQETREEHYKADDASSAVVRDTQEINHESENLVTESSDKHKENREKEELENDSRTNGTEDVSKDGAELHDVLVNGDSQLNNNTSLMEEAVTERKPEVDLSNSTVALESAGHIEEYSNTTSDSNVQMDEQNDSTFLQSDDQSEQPNNSTETINQVEQHEDLAISELSDQAEQQNTSTGTNDQIEQHGNSTISESSEQIEQQNNLTGTNVDEQVETDSWSGGASAETVDSTHENATVNEDSAQNQNIMDETRTLAEDNSSSENISMENNLTGTNVDEQVETHSWSGGASAETVDFTHENATVNEDSAQNQNIMDETRTLSEDNSSSENISMEQTEKSDQTVGMEASNESDKTSSASDENGDSIQGESTNSSSHMVTAITEEEQDARTNLPTLPEVETKSVEGIAAE